VEEKSDVSSGATMRRLRRLLSDLGLDQIFANDQIIFDGELFVLPKLSNEAVSRITTRFEQLLEQSTAVPTGPIKQVSTIFESDHQIALNKELAEFHTVPVGYSVAFVKVDQ
jgi:23S rRNA-/tRNA-specific pseudouridylate synthase